MVKYKYIFNSNEVLTPALAAKTAFEITATMNNGDKWMTVRNTFKGMDSVVKDILKDKKVKKFTVEEKKCWPLIKVVVYWKYKVKREEKKWI